MQQYEVVAKARLKVYSISQLGYMFLTAYNLGNSTFAHLHQHFVLQLKKKHFFMQKIRYRKRMIYGRVSLSKLNCCKNEFAN